MDPDTEEGYIIRYILDSFSLSQMNALFILYPAKQIHAQSG